MEWNNLSMSQRSELMQIYLKNGITSLDEMKKHYNSFAEGGLTSPSYPPFNGTPQRTDISDNEKRARGKWHVENAKKNQQSIITKAFNEAKSKGLTTEQAYEYVADVAKQHGWSKEGSIVEERTIPYKVSPNTTSSDNNISPKYITSEPMSEEEYQRRKALQSIRQSQETGNPDVIYDSDEKVKRDNPNNPRTPFEPHPITPKEMDVTLKGLKFLQPFDPTGLTGVPDFLNSVASGKGIGINFVGMLPAIGKVKAVENGSRLARFNNSLMDTGEEVLGNLIGRVSPKAGNFINTTTSAVQDITSKPAEEIVKQLMQKRGTQAANRFVTGWNLGATAANFGRAGEDVYDFFTEDPLVQRIKEGFQFAEGGSIGIPPTGPIRRGSYTGALPPSITYIPVNKYTRDQDKYFYKYEDSQSDATFKKANPKPKRIRKNDSPTSSVSSALEDSMNYDLSYNTNPTTGNKVPSGHPKNYSVPYIEDKEININGNRVSTNLLDTLYKYSEIADIPFKTGLGLAAQETRLGSIPLYNYEENDDYEDVPFTNRDLANTNYFRNYGTIPMFALVRDWDWYYNTDHSEHPLVHAFNKFKEGTYNRGDKNHTKDVLKTGEEAFNSSAVQEWGHKNGYFATGGSLDIPPYTQFLNTLPDNLKNSGDEYNMRRYWELNNYPKDFNEGIQLGMFTKQDDGYHANSVAFNPITNSYEFMKDRNHPTYNMELDWYYSDDPEAVEFRKKYKYTPGIGMIPDQYTPIY